jgi:hypothetical protein
MELTAVKDNEIKEEVVAAYNEVLRKLTVAKPIPADEDEREQQEVQERQEEKAAQEKAHVIDVASKETPDELVRNLSDLKLFVSKSLDEIKTKLLPEYEKFFTLRQAIAFSEAELKELNGIKVNAHTLTALMQTQKEKIANFERDVAERKRIFVQEKLQMERERQKEESDYATKLHAVREADQEQYRIAKRDAEQSLAAQRAAFEEECESREARLSAREKEHQQVREREAWIIAREQEYQQLKEKVGYHPEELRLAVQKVERNVVDQLTRKYEYDAKLSQIELESERKMYQQKIAALEEQIEQYKTLKQLFNQSSYKNNAEKEKK